MFWNDRARAFQKWRKLSGRDEVFVQNIRPLGIPLLVNLRALVEQLVSGKESAEELLSQSFLRPPPQSLPRVTADLGSIYPPSESGVTRAAQVRDFLATGRRAA